MINTVVSITFEKENKVDVAAASAVDALFTELFDFAEREPRKLKDYEQINFFMEFEGAHDLEALADSLK